jgi:hypothetical protein
MGWRDHVFNYCERGTDAAFWAEPLNAWSNTAFIAAGLFGLIALARRPAGQRGLAEALLSILVVVIGVGSFLFHTYAQRWSIYADTVPIGVFLFAFLAYALRRFCGLHWLLVATGLVLFAWAERQAFTVACPRALAAYVRGTRCLNGTLGYAPALFALVTIGTGLATFGRRAGKYLLAAAAVFLVSMAMRTFDLEWCSSFVLLGRRTGTHFLWHILNAATLLILLMAAIRHGPPADATPPS